MRVVQGVNYFYIAKGRERVSYFAFFVGSRGSCWSMKRNAHPYKTKAEAEQGVTELRQRGRRQGVRKGRGEGRGVLRAESKP